MTLYKKYYNNKIELKFYPDDMVVYMEPKREGSKEDLRAYKEKLQVFLNIKSSNFTKSEGKPVFTLQLDKKTPPDAVDEYLKQKFHGGDEVEDPATMGEEEEEPEPQPNPQDPQAQQQPPQPGMDQQMPPMEEEPQMESFFIKAFEILSESTYRTAKYWEILARAAGRGKQSIDEKTVLSLRKQYVKKPKSKGRNETLRSLDKASSYFYRKMKSLQGENAAMDFKNKYKQIGELVPSDYSDTNTHEKLSSEESSPFDLSNGMNSEENMEKTLSFKDFFDEDGEGEDEEDAYEDYERFESEE
jgi:hypothetical protein